MKTFRISRRTLLRGLGATMALPSLEIMSPVGARAAAGAKAPKRLLCVFQPNGVFPKAWDVTDTA
ncbi:MAG: transcriptional initiation protein Tat, partial [Verrucomicrobiae bacterium]|nr:transcriptional initiation protein Tat [Verrucomicrobiae bacterium]